MFCLYLYFDCGRLRQFPLITFTVSQPPKYICLEELLWKTNTSCAVLILNDTEIIKAIGLKPNVKLESVNENQFVNNYFTIDSGSFCL